MTGNKRFWPVKCGDKIDSVQLEADKGQLWAEAVALYRAGFKWWIPEGDPLFLLCAQAANKRIASHPWEEAVVNYIHGRNNVSCIDIIRHAIEKPLERIKKSDEMAVAGILKANGFIKSHDGKNRGWERQIMQMRFEA